MQMFSAYVFPSSSFKNQPKICVLAELLIAAWREHIWWLVLEILLKWFSKLLEWLCSSGITRQSEAPPMHHRNSLQHAEGDCWPPCISYIHLSPLIPCFSLSNNGECWYLFGRCTATFLCAETKWGPVHPAAQAPVDPRGYRMEVLNLGRPAAKREEIGRLEEFGMIVCLGEFATGFFLAWRSTWVGWQYPRTWQELPANNLGHFWPVQSGRVAIPRTTVVTFGQYKVVPHLPGEGC